MAGKGGKNNELIFLTKGGKLDYIDLVSQHTVKVILLDLQSDPKFKNCVNCRKIVPISGMKDHLKGCRSSDFEPESQESKKPAKIPKTLSTKRDNLKQSKAKESSGVKVKLLPLKCQFCDQRFETRKGRNTHALEHMFNKTKTPAVRGRPRARKVQRKKLKTKKLSSEKPNTKVGTNVDVASFIINSKQLQVRLPNILPL